MRLMKIPLDKIKCDVIPRIQQGKNNYIRENVQKNGQQDRLKGIRTR